MRILALSVLVGLIGVGCSTKHHEEELTAPEETRFIKEVFASNLYEPTELAVLPKSKILFTQRRGGIKQYDLQSGELSTYDSIAVYHVNEDGLMGMALDPEFEQNEWIYFYYSPVGNMAVNRLSRFSYTPNGLKNEVVVLEVPVQREECCHTGGSLQFGGDGLLYLSTGDNTNPFASEGFSPSDEQPGREAWDAQRSSSNTNDLRGKILRIKPEPDGSYTIPQGNLFVDDDPKTRPEIYVMGCRNPYRISIDSKRGWLFWGDVGPDASNDREGRGPRGYDEFNVALKPGYFGWPLFVGDNFAYNEWDFANNTGDAAYDPKKPINNSPNNTGLQELPPANPAKIFYPYARFEKFPQLQTGGRNAMAGPVFYTDEYDAPTKFPAYFDGRVIYYDWMRGYIFFLELDDQGNPVDWYEFMPNTEFNNVIDMEFGPDGQLYMIEYGTGWFTQNENARLSRINYVKGNRPPILKTTLSETRGAAPFEVSFDASASMDYDGDDLTYKWSIDGEVYSDSIITVTFEKEGVYYPELILSDGRNNIKEQFVVEVGNEPPVVEVQVSGNSTFFWPNRKLDYAVKVSDMEDDQSTEGVDQSKIEFDIAHYQSSDMAEVLGHQSPVSNGQTLIDGLDCKACHKLDGSSIGPSYTQVANKYQKNEQSVEYLSRKIIAGGGGVWGEQAMSAHPDLSVADAEQIVEYILSIGQQNKLPLAGSYQTTENGGKYLLSASYEDQGKGPLKPIKEQGNLWLRYHVIPGDQFDESHEIQARGGVINSIYHNSWVLFKDVDLTDIDAIKVTYGQYMRGADISIRLGGANGEEIGRARIDPSDNIGISREIAIKPTAIKTDLCLFFENPKEKNQLIMIEKIEFVPKTDAL